MGMYVKSTIIFNVVFLLVDIILGDVISWGESCRIKHMPTRLYLSIDYELQVCMNNVKVYYIVHIIIFPG